jgi:Flp pilus assembly protein TadG
VKTLTILFGLTLAALAVGVRADQGRSKSSKKEVTMTAQGTFEVKVTPQPQDDSAGGPFARLFLDKQFHGELDATSKGQMLGAGTAVEGSGGYVALELVTGKLNGNRGSFILQHTGTMSKGVYLMHVTVVPDSGTDELAGIAGTMTIIIEGSKHSYNFEYTLPEK